MAPLLYESAFVLILLLLTAAAKEAKYPKLPLCHKEDPQVVEDDQPPGFFNRKVCTGSIVEQRFSLARNEEVFITVAVEISEETPKASRGTGSLQFRPNDRRRSLQLSRIESFDFFVDRDEPLISEGGLGILVVQSKLLDGTSNTLSTKSLTSDSSTATGWTRIAGLWGRGQPNTRCAHPSRLELEEEFQDSSNPVCGLLNATWYLHRYSEGWNSAATTFVGAPSIFSRDGWCGSINEHSEKLVFLQSCDNNPKWFVPQLKLGDVLSITVELLAASTDRTRSQVELKLYTGGVGREPEFYQTLATMTFQKPHHAQTFKARFTNENANQDEFYVELVQRRQHVYRYAIAFRVDAACQDSPPKHKFTLIKEKSCQFLKKLLRQDKVNQVQDICNSLESNADVVCPVSCSSCLSTCEEAKQTKFRLWQRQNSCKWLRNKSVENQSKLCRDVNVQETCPVTCDACEQKASQRGEG